MADLRKGIEQPHLRLLHGKNLGDITDPELCVSFLEGHDGAFAELVQRHQALVYGLLRRYATPEEARDLTQRAFVQAMQAVRRLIVRVRAPKELRFRSWLLRIAVNLGKNHARQERRWQRLPIAVVEERSTPGPSALESLEQQEREHRVRATVVKLPKRQREVVSLRIDGDLSFSEIAECLQITENNAKVHFHHAVKRLQSLILGEVGGE